MGIEVQEEPPQQQETWAAAAPQTALTRPQRPVAELVKGEERHAAGGARQLQVAPHGNINGSALHRRMVGQLQEALGQVLLAGGRHKVEAAVVVRELAVVGAAVHVVDHALLLQTARGGCGAPEGRESQGSTNN